MGKHLAPVDLETLCELDVGAGERACTEVQDGGVANPGRLRPRLAARHLRRLHGRWHPGVIEQSRA
jgi:hypothetical protein